MVQLLQILIALLVNKTICFNPTVVRLLQVEPHHFPVKFDWFQSHSGAIAARYAAANIPFTVIVSIPQWCDCC